MESFILYSHSYMQDWPAEQGSIDLCATSEYPNKKDVLKKLGRYLTYCWFDTYAIVV